MWGSGEPGAHGRTAGDQDGHYAGHCSRTTHEHAGCHIPSGLVPTPAPVDSLPARTTDPRLTAHPARSRPSRGSHAVVGVVSCLNRARGDTVAIVEKQVGATGDDSVVIAELHEIVARQRTAFLADPFPSLETRQGSLGALVGMLLGHRVQIEDAMNSDFGAHPRLAADLIEVLGPAGRAGYAAEQLETWMAPEPRWLDPALFGSARAFVQPQPKGVVGNIVPWNFPFDLSVGPLVEMLAAGNRVVIKPSEYAPACGELLRDMIRATFDRDQVDVVTGGVDLAQAFAPVPAGTISSTPGARRSGGRSPRRRRSSSCRSPWSSAEMPGDHHGGQHRPRIGQAGAWGQDDQERSDVHLSGLLPGPSVAIGGVRSVDR